MSNLPPHELERLIARQKSYTDSCVFVVVLYVLLWVPGVIANYLYLKDAESAEAAAGQALPGVAGLRLMWTLACLLFGIVASLVVFALLLVLFRGFR